MTHTRQKAPAAPRAFALDVGGSFLKAALVARDGRLLFRTETPALPERPPEQIEGDLVKLHDRAAAENARLAAGSLPPPPTGLALPGVLSPDGRTMARADHLPTLNGFPLVARLRRRWGPDLAVGSDSLCAALADYTVGAGGGVARLLVAVVGTGVGAAVLHDGRPSSRPGLGQVELDLPPECGSPGRRVRLETVASAAALDRAIRRAAGAELDFDAIRAVIESGAPAELAAVRRWAAAVAAGLAVWKRLYQPERFVIAGGLTAYGPPLLDIIRQACGAQPGAPKPAEVHFSPLGRSAALVGAGLSGLRVAADPSGRQPDH